MNSSRAAAAKGRFRLPELGEETMPPPSGDRVPIIVAALVVATIAVGLTAKAFDVYWGAPAQPLFVIYDPIVATWLLPSLAGVAAALFAGFRLVNATTGPARFGLYVFALTLLSQLALNLARFGPDDWWVAFRVRPEGAGRLEYLATMTELKVGIGPFLDNFAELVPTLPLHPAGHPPGLVVLLDLLGIQSPQAMAALTIVVGAAAAPILYVLGRQLFDEGTARAASLLFVFVPTVLLYGTTSADSLFMTLGLLAALCMLSRRSAVMVLGAFLLALASFFSYALLVAGGWAGLVKWRRDGFKPMVKLALLCGAMLIAFYGVFALSTGFDVIGSIEATHDRYYQGVAGIRPYLFYFFGSPAAFLVMLGPVAWYASRALGAREATALALAGAILVIVVSGVTKAESERIWLFLVPMACLAAARGLPETSLKPVLAALVAQAVAIQVLFDTTW